ncbi:MAG: hypothetical protein KDB22_15330 [Planctomycetales bacterium]|nr:hypothetical protein [Planctomycetales bacterium]
MTSALWIIAQLPTTGNSALIAFVIYIIIVLFLAWLSSRFISQGSFLSEYFLGGRKLGVWTFALTFAATSASGGSFIGFPAMVYTHGWSVGLWIASYMLMPLVAMGLLAKRLNQLARKTDAITVPDLLHSRFESPTFGLISTVLIVFFLTCNLVAQFKGGSVILLTLLADVPLFQTAAASFASLSASSNLIPSQVDPAYVLCLLVFSLAVIVYTTYGGFRAVVWTDVLQGFVMVGGIIFLLPMTIWAVGGLSVATRNMADEIPPEQTYVQLQWNEPGTEEPTLTKNAIVSIDDQGQQRIFRLTEPSQINAAGLVSPVLTRSEQESQEIDPMAVKALELFVPAERIRHELVLTGFSLVAPSGPKTVYRFGAGQRGGYVSLPGPSASADAGFLPLSVAISFFCFWCFASAGQPSNMIRCMAFENTTILSRAIFTVSIYFSLIYFPIVLIFCCARTLLPGWESDADRIMPEMVATVTTIYGVPWLAGLLVAAPFAAVMSTVDSFLLMISSSFVRDIYGRWINPHPSESHTKRLTYLSTFAVGLAAMLASVNPPNLLQAIIVFTGAGFATSFLCPVALAMYWPRFNSQGAIAGMLVGFFSNVLLYGIGTYQTGEISAYEPLRLSPFLVGCLSSLVACVVVCWLTPPPSSHIIRKFFYRAVKV